MSVSVGELWPVDLNLACEGYLRSADGSRVRMIPGLERIVLEMLDQDVQLVWGEPPDGLPGVSLIWRRQIVVARWLFRKGPREIKDVLTHELGHVVKGSLSCAAAREWQLLRYGDLLEEELGE